MPILIQLISVLTPFVPLISKGIDAKKDLKQVVAKTTGATEVAHVSYISALMFIIQDIQSCGVDLSLESLSCVTNDHWILLITSVFFAVQRAWAKSQ